MPAAEGEQSDTPQLASVCEKTLPAKCKPSTLTYCPTMDLIALATEDDQVNVYRFNGQEALGGQLGKAGVTVKGTRWKSNGRILAIAGSDNNVRLVSAHSGKAMHDLACGPPQGKESGSIAYLGWGAHRTDGKPGAESLLRSTGEKRETDDFLAPDSSPVDLDRIKVDLPRELAALDIERSLPKPSVLPSTGDEDDVFSSRASLDSMFDAATTDANESIDVLLAGFDDGTVHLRIFDCFEIGSLNVRSSFRGADFCKVLAHSSSPLSSTHSLIFSVSGPKLENHQLRLLMLDLRFITKSGQYLPLLASKVTQLQNLLRYIKQTQNQIYLEWKTAQELPNRYISNVNEDLQEQCECDFVTAVYHLLVTADCFPPLKEFLVDQVGERGHKRWEKALGSGYANIRRLTHECLLPALERCGVIISRLIGLSKYYRLSPVLGLGTKELKESLETVDCLNLMAHKILICSGRELREFGEFAKWLRHEIDLQTAEPLSAAAEEEMEKSGTVDYHSTLSYVQGAMTSSSLLDFIKPTTHPETEHVYPTDNGSFYQSYKTLLKQQEQQKPGQRVAMPKLGDLISRLQRQCESVFKQVAETQRRGILHRSPLMLSSDCDENVLDILTMLTTMRGKETMDQICIAAKSKNCPYKIYIYQVVLDTVNGVSSTQEIRVSSVSLGAGEVLDIKLVSEESALMILWRDASPSASTHLASLSLESFAPGSSIPLDSQSSGEGTPQHREKAEYRVIHMDLLDPECEGDSVLHTFDAQQAAEPLRLQVNAKKGRRAVCVLYSDGLRYTVFDMDSAPEARADGEGDDVEIEEEVLPS